MNIFKVDMNSYSAWNGLLLPIIYSFLAFIIFCFGIIYFGDKYVACPNLGNSLEKQVKYNFWAGGCFIKLTNGNLISADRYNGVTLEN